MNRFGEMILSLLPLSAYMQGENAAFSLSAKLGLD